METKIIKNKVVDMQLITDRQLQNRWQRTDVTLWRLRKAGALPFVQVGRHPRYRLADILDLEANGVPCSTRIHPTAR
jgi:hypothetical protein